jgi:hypothetical protein
MLELLLSHADGGSAWRHTLAVGNVRSGWECVGPLGLARRLGRLYGLPGEPAPQAERVAAYAARLARLAGDRSFSRSRAKDPWGVAEFMLGLGDRLRAAGWDGGELKGSQRLLDLAEVERLAEPGLGALPLGVERLFAALLVEIERGELPQELAINLASPLGAFDPVVRRVLDALSAKGAAVAANAAERLSASVTTDLGRLQHALLSSDLGDPEPALAGDGTVLLLEADTPLEAGELAAGALRSLVLGETMLVEGRDLGALEAALLRQGLPALGVGDRSRLRPALQVLPLRLALAFAPRDPFVAAELLMLRVAPLSRGIRRRLLEALQEQPGIGGPAWELAVAEVAITDEDRTRIESWFGGPTFDPQAGLPAAEAVRICELVARWADGRARAAESPGDSEGLLLGAAQVARTMATMVAQQPPGALLSPVELEQLHDIAAGGGLDGASTLGEAGRLAITPEPGATLPGAQTVVWWGFLGGDGGPAPEPWSEAEREALAAKGIVLRAPGELRALEAAGWRRAMLSASERLVLVRWRLEGTSPTVDHPLADEIRARVEKGLAACTVTSESVLALPPGGTLPLLGAGGRAGTVPTSLRPPAPEITPRTLFRVPPETLSTDRLSPSSIEKLLGCPVAWVLEFAADLRRRGVARIPSGNRLLGSFAHAILQDVLLGPRKVDLAAGTPEDAAKAARVEFEARVEQEAAPLVSRGAEVARHRARELVGEAARTLFDLLQRGGWRPRAAEAELEGTFEEAALAGRADLVAEKADTSAIIDLKLGSLSYYREKLKNGEALQVALYSDLARGGGTLPPTGYFMINRGELLTVDTGAFPGALEIDGPSMEETLAATREALRFWRAVLAKGIVASRHKELREGSMLEAGEAAGKTIPASGPGAMEPGCRFCEHGVVCSVALREVVR